MSVCLPRISTVALALIYLVIGKMLEVANAHPNFLRILEKMIVYISGILIFKGRSNA